MPEILEAAALLPQAQAIVSDLLQRLGVMVQQAQERQGQLKVDLRKAERVLEEAKIQTQFALQQASPHVQSFGEREQALRLARNVLAQESVGLEHALKQLDQLVRQIDMSSASLGGPSAEEEAADPWVLALRSQVILGREEERVRLAREVHDGPAQVLANTLMGLSQSRSLLQEQRLDRLQLNLDRLCDVTREGLQEIRQFIADLRPGKLADQGLVPALHDYIQRYSTAYGTRVKFEPDPLPRLPTEVEIVLYRIVQEALQNAHKHARGAAIQVNLGWRKETLQLSIRDDGPGFNPREVARRAGRESWGLTSMRERAELVGAKFVVTSRQGHGTEVLVTLSLRK